MKLQLNENTLNAYINEAIQQELNENYRVNFEKLGEPELQVIKNHKAARRRLERGAYNRMSLISTRKLRKVLNDMGYSDDQIGAGLNNGAIEVGNGVDNSFRPYQNIYRQNRKDARLRSRMNMPIADNGQDSQGKQENQAEAWDGSFPWDNTTPVWTPRKPKTQAPAPEEAPAQPERQKLEPLAPVQAPTNMPTGVTAPEQPGLIQRQPQQSLAKSAVQVMGQTANQSNMGLRDRISTNRRTRQNANNAIDQMVRDGSMSRQQARDDKKLMKGAEKALGTGKPMN